MIRRRLQGLALLALVVMMLPIIAAASADTAKLSPAKLGPGGGVISEQSVQGADSGNASEVDEKCSAEEYAHPALNGLCQAHAVVPPFVKPVIGELIFAAAAEDAAPEEAANGNDDDPANGNDDDDPANGNDDDPANGNDDDPANGNDDDDPINGEEDSENGTGDLPLLTCMIHADPGSTLANLCNIYIVAPAFIQPTIGQLIIGVATPEPAVPEYPVNGEDPVNGDDPINGDELNDFEEDEEGLEGILP